MKNKPNTTQKNAIIAGLLYIGYMAVHVLTQLTEVVPDSKEGHPKDAYPTIK